MSLKATLSTLAVSFLRLLLLVYDIATFPFFAMIYEPWKAQLANKRSRAKIVSRTKDSVTIASEDNFPSFELREEILRCPEGPLDTMVKLFHFAVNKHKEKPCLGTREVFSEEREQQPDGKVFTKLIQGEYKWKNYNQVSEQVTNVARGLREMGVEKNEKIVIYADTRAEWMVAALACFQNSITLVTLYTNLGEEGVVHGIGQTKVKTVITSQELLPKLRKIAATKVLPHLQSVIYFENRNNNSSNNREEEDTEGSGLKLISFSKLECMGSKTSHPFTSPTRNDLAIIMYTSGSSGTPKGALITHGHISSAITSCLAFGVNMMGDIRSDNEAYLAYLPLAHIFELSQEMIGVLMGVKVGYSGPNTLTDSSTMVKSGQKGDATVLKPTQMAAVPVVLDRIYKGMRGKVREKGIFFDTLFEMLFRYRLFWTRHGMDTPVLNKVIFGKFRAALGGNMRAIVGGGAPLNSEVHDFLRTCLCVTLAQGYGLTETAGGVTLCDRDDLSTGRVGTPLSQVKIKLQSWKEGGYTVDDPQGPRGEIVIGCPWVALGYYDNNNDEDKESFMEDEEGNRWFKSGDVGQMMEDGTVKIVDRKKDLVKLQMGEYVSLGKVESRLKVHPMVDNVCVYADPTKNSTVALIVPDEAKLREAAEQLFGSSGSPHSMVSASREELCANPKMIMHVLEVVRVHAARQLERFEIPKGVELIPELWLPDTGLVTAALKLRRKIIQQHYQEVIDRLYASLEEMPKVKVH